MTNREENIIKAIHLLMQTDAEIIVSTKPKEAKIYIDIISPMPEILESKDIIEKIKR